MQAGQQAAASQVAQYALAAATAEEALSDAKASEEQLWTRVGTFLRAAATVAKGKEGKKGSSVHGGSGSEVPELPALAAVAHSPLLPRAAAAAAVPSPFRRRLRSRRLGPRQGPQREEMERRRRSLWKKKELFPLPYLVV